MTPQHVTIVEVGPRDGLQNEQTSFDVQTRVDFISRLVAAGLKRIEAVSFVNPKRVPQMADAEEVMAALPRSPGVSYIGLVLNDRGFDRAIGCDVDEINYVVCASETFNLKNQGVTTEQTLTYWERLAARARNCGIPCSVTISNSFGCPFEGEIPVQRVADIAKRVAESGADEIALADTIGAAAPSDVTLRLSAAKAVAPSTRLRVHLHNTRNTGIANAYAALNAGVDIIDASTGGIGGCPFAPRATGNIPTDDLVYMLDRMGIATDVSLERIVETSHWLEERLNKEVPSLVARAGAFPPARTD